MPPQAWNLFRNNSEINEMEWYYKKRLQTYSDSFHKLSKFLQSLYSDTFTEYFSLYINVKAKLFQIAPFKSVN